MHTHQLFASSDVVRPVEGFWLCTPNLSLSIASLTLSEKQLGPFAATIDLDVPGTSRQLLAASIDLDAPGTVRLGDAHSSVVR